MEILNLPAAPTKDVFTAKTEKGYVGCVRTELCWFFTLESFSNALQAANAARSLRKKLTAPQASPNLSSFAKSTKLKKSSGRSKKPVTWQNRLYTLAEVETMPLLRFKEVWIILHGGEYVADCLNHEKKQLVKYTSSKDKARLFPCHEAAKSTMRTLRGVVGPGFDLMRMFIQVRD